MGPVIVTNTTYNLAKELAGALGIDEYANGLQLIHQTRA